MKQTTQFILYLFIIILLSVPAFSEEDADFKRFSVGTRISSMNIGTTNMNTGDMGDVEGQFNGTATYGINFSYYINKKFSLELSVDTLEAKLNVKHDTEKGGLGKLKQRPTLLTARMHFPINKLSGNFFLGAGFGHYYNDFTNETDPNEKNDLFAQNMTVSIRESFGAHINVGSEYFLTDNIALNLDIKLVMKSTEAAFTPFDSTTTQERDISMNASFLGVGLKYFF